ncbi:MAG: polysaccharide biosynthesis C-terminal domain-containing protein [Candidatus Aenigmatarchaeota archaeon]
MVSSILFLLIRWLDIFMLSIFKTSYEVGIYNAALPTASILILVLYSFKYMLLPKSTEFLSNGNIKEMKENYQTTVKWIFLLTLPIFVLMLIFPGKFLGFLFGSEFTRGGMTLSVLAIGYFYASIIGPTGDILISAGKTKQFMAIFSVITILDLTMNYLLIPTWSYLGAGIALTTSFIIGWSFSVILVYRELKIIPFNKKLLKPSLLALLFSMPLYILTKNYEMSISQIVIVSVAFVVIYVSMLFKLKVFEEQELKLIKSFKDRVCGWNRRNSQ